MNDNDVAARMYAAATPQDRGERVPGAGQGPPATTTAATKPNPALAATQPGSAIGSRMYGTTSTPPPAASTGTAPPAGKNATQVAGPSLAERMYPEADKAAPSGDALVQLALDRFAPSELELLDREQPIEDRMAEAGAVQLEEPAGYEAVLSPGFDALEQEARATHNAEDIKALAEGRKVAAELMHALAVPTQQAKEVVSAMSAWRGRELTEEQVEDLGERTVAELRAEWGKDYEAKLRMAQRAATEATRQAPWLAELWRTGAGNDPALVRHFAGVGLRAARKARRAKA